MKWKVQNLGLEDPSPGAVVSLCELCDPGQVTLCLSFLPCETGKLNNHNSQGCWGH